MIVSLVAYFLYRNVEVQQGPAKTSGEAGGRGDSQLSRQISDPSVEGKNVEHIQPVSCLQDVELAELERIRNPIQREKALTAFFRRWGAEDPLAAIDRARQFPARLREKLIDATLLGWVLKAPNSAWQWASNVATGLTPDEKDRYVRNTMQPMIEALMEADRPRDVVGIISSMPNGLHRSRFTKEIATQWAETDSMAALAWLGTLTDPIDRSNALGGVVMYLSTEDPDSATKYARSLSNPNDRSVAITSVIQPILQNGDVAATLSWLKAGSHLPEYDSARISAILNLGPTDTSIFVPLLDDMADPSLKFNAAQEAVLITSRSNPAQAIQLATKYYNSEQFDKAAPRLFSRWAKTDYQAAYNFAAALDVITEPQRQKVLESIASTRKPKL